jgi:hypothetical protein
VNRTLIALAVVVALITGIVVAGRSAATPGESKVHQPPPTGPGIQTPVKIILECENPSALEDKAPNGTVMLRKGTITLGQTVGYLEFPDGTIDDAGLKELKLKNNEVGGLLPGKAFYDVTAPRDGDYYLFLRAQWMDECGDSVFVRMDQSPYEKMEDTEGKVSDKVYKWAWHPLQEMGEPKPFRLKAGPHRLELAIREDGPKFDKFLLSTDATPPARDTADP